MRQIYKARRQAEDKQRDLRCKWIVNYLYHILVQNCSFKSCLLRGLDECKYLVEINIRIRLLKNHIKYWKR